MATITQKFVRRARARGVAVRTRGQWGGHGRVSLAVYGWRRIFRKHAQIPHSPTDTLVQHITVTRDDGPTVGDFDADMRELHAIGVARFGTGVSYNLGWDMRTGMIGLGQSLDAAGAHTLNDKHVPNYSSNMNYTALAVAAIGEVGDRPSDVAVEKLAQTIAALMDVGALTTTFDYDPHSKFAFKDCPTDAVRDIMPNVRARALELHNEFVAARRRAERRNA